MDAKGKKNISIRDYVPNDEGAIEALAAAEDMGHLSGFEETLVATDEENRIVGFCRVRTIDGIHYVNPVVSSPEVRGDGVGKMLMNAARERFGELRFVARGYAVPFYRHIGCTEIPWKDITPIVAGDCDDCNRAATCNPLPMRYR